MVLSTDFGDFGKTMLARLPAETTVPPAYGAYGAYGASPSYGAQNAANTTVYPGTTSMRIA